MPDWSALSYVVVDVEGNGGQPPDLVELAAVPIIDGRIGQPLTWLVQPDEPIKHFATRIHGLRDDDVADAPRFPAIRDEVLAALDADALIAHNAHVDTNVLQRKLAGWAPPEVFDTLKLARRMTPGLASYRLGALVDRWNLAAGLPDDLAPHRATYDALVTARLFVHLATDAGGHRASLAVLRGQTPDDGEGEPAVLF